MLLVCIRSYLILVLRYKYLILDTCHLETLYLRERGCEDPWLFFEAKRGPREKKFGKHGVKGVGIFDHVAIKCFVKKRSHRWPVICSTSHIFAVISARVTDKMATERKNPRTKFMILLVVELTRKIRNIQALTPSVKR
jgi:hypothetical protein